MNISDLSRELATKTGLTFPNAKQYVDIMFAEIMREMRRGGVVRIRDFGTFTVAERKAGKGHNPRTGEAIEYPAARRVKLTSALAMKKSLNPIREQTRARRRA